MESLAFIATLVVLLCAILAIVQLLRFRAPEYKGLSNFETSGFDTLPVGVVITDPNQPDNPIVYCNSAFQNITGYSRSEIMGRNCRFLQGEDRDQAGIQTLRSALVEKRVCTATLRNYRKDKTMFWNEVTISPIFDNQGHPMFCLGLQQDVTHRQQDTVALLEQNQRLVMNQGTLLELARYDANNLESSLQKYLIVAAVQLATPRVSLWQLDESTQQLSCTLMIRHGELTTENQTMSVADHPLFFGALQNNQIITISDLTDTLSRLDIDLKYIIERNISAAMYIPININREFVGFIGHEQVGKQKDWSRDDREFSRYIADLCAVALIAQENQEATRKLEETEQLLAEARKVGQLGSFIWYYQNDRLVFSNEIVQVLDLKDERPDSMLELCERIRRDSQAIFMTDARQAISHHNERWVGIYPFSASNSETRYCEIVAQVSELDTQTGLRGTIQDVTTRVLTEKENESLQQRLLQAEKLETIGTLARGIAHDFNNLLTPLIGYAELLAADYSDGDRQLNYTNEIIHSGIRAKQLIEQLLIFSAHRQADHPEIDILAALEDIVQSIRPKVDCSVMLEANLDEASRKIHANSGQLRQVLTNLCFNANSAMQGQGTILINSFATTAAALPESRTGDKRSFIAIQVEDSGPGISDSYVEHIFEPFFTTREVGEGTGLGLSVVHGIVKQHSGEISVNSKPGHTSITIFLPYEPKSPTPELTESDSVN
jgi:PAS domain S-box-containing protein